MKTRTVLWAVAAGALTLAASSSALAACGAPVGDLDGNGVTNVVDVQCEIVAILAALGRKNPDPPACLAVDPAYADIDCSGDITVTDATLLIGAALGDTPSVSIDPNQNGCPDACEVDACGDGLCDAGLEVCTGCPADCDCVLPAWRIDSLALADPHLWLEGGFGCTDLNEGVFGFTVNSALQDAIDNPDNSKIVFLALPLDPGEPNGTLQYWSTTCDAAGVCQPALEEVAPEFVTPMSNQLEGTCLAPEPGTTSYTPAPNSSTAPCFSTDPVDVALFFGDFIIPFTGLQIGGEFAMDSEGPLTGGLLRGYVTQTAAAGAIVPLDIAVIGGSALGDLMINGDAPGGADCEGDDSDPLPDGTPGWWIYFEYTAEPVLLSL